ncbi:MAG TPA: DUF2255 family protein [Candidatus Dormibacteraeota bacterium]
MAKADGTLLWKLAESDEVEIETRGDARSPAHRTIIWIVPTQDGVYIRSVKGKRGRWYQEAIANPQVVIHVGRRQAPARAITESSSKVISEVSAAYREKYGERWPEETEPMLKGSVLSTTLRLEPL